MAHTALAIPQVPADCRWSRPWPLAQPEDSQSTHTSHPHVWTCVHGTARMVYEEECRTCPYWEPAAAGAAHTIAASTVAAAPRAIDWLDVVRVSTRVVAILIAALFAAIGVSILTSPGAIPLTVMLWLGGAAFAGFGVFCPLPGTAARDEHAGTRHP